MLSTMNDLSLALGDAYRSLRLAVRGQPFPNAALDWDRDALDVTVDVDTGTFRGSFQTLVWAHELSNLRSLLHSLLDQLGQDLMAEFEFREVAIETRFEVRRGGAFIVQVALRPSAAENDRLTFELSLSPAQVTNWIEDLDRILSHFPPAIATNYTPARDITPTDPSVG
jgi:hypothetical protein